MLELQERSLTSFIAKLLRDAFGKGPEAIHVSMGGRYVVMYLKRFMSPMERVLESSGQLETVVQTRMLIMETLIPELKGAFYASTDVLLTHLYYDWNFDTHSGVIVGVAAETKWAMPEDFKVYPTQSDVENRVSEISIQVEKKPIWVSSCYLNDRTLVVFREGILVPIEHAFVANGYSDILRRTKWTLEKHHFSTDTVLQQLVQRKIVDLFVDWNFQEDNSVLVCVLDKPRHT